ncbi:TetR/AcrR family transcriptional regulator [Actinomadura craniellae]|uniref:TetR/AcrR family transcriptional regulator n=1 Tax=Actinomadura craniellae TaxID=2231787 RepID=A0A365H4H7_9ACTN|nr:TetR/AcrR family transcriptional regulator [Actinomadura craniellae]RAY14014.1 TetR/AcrR family transcriptional regulator [Actinomadura craniellae]
MVPTDYGRAGPERSVRLMWEDRGGEGSPTRRPGLTLDRIVRTAIEIADADGLAGLSMRAVAERLGFTTMSLYRHVPGKAELLDLMQEAVHGEMILADEEAGDGRSAPDGWRAALTRYAHREWEMYQRHPWALEIAITRRVPGPHAITLFDSALRAVSETGLTPGQMVAVVELVGGYVGGVARRAAQARLIERRTGVSDDQWWADRASLFEHFGDGRFPTLTAIWQAGGFDEPVADQDCGSAGFEFGLDRVLDGVAALIETRRRDESCDIFPLAAYLCDETWSEGGTADGPACTVCGRPVARAGTGRPREYCSRACQQRAYRARRGTEAPTEEPDAPGKAVAGTPPR